MIARIFGWVIAATFVLVLLGVASLALYRRPLQAELAARTAIRSSAGIESLERIDVRGDGQWIFLRGEKRSAPILLVVHGGPGSAQLSLTRHFDAGLVDHFIVAHPPCPMSGRAARRGSGESASEAARRRQSCPRRSARS